MKDEKPQALYVLLAVTAASFLTPFMASSVTVAIPIIGADLHLGAVALNWVVTAYLLSTAAFLLPAGRAADIHGRARLFTTGMICYAVMSLACSLAPSGNLLVAARFGQGIASSMIFSTGIAMLTGSYPPAERGRVFGLNVAAVYTGLSAGPVLGGVITQHIGWRYLFAINALLGALIFVIARLRISDRETEIEHKSFDAAGATLYVLGLSLALYGISAVYERPAQAALAAGIVLIVLFFRREQKNRTPLLDLSLFKNPVFAFSNLAAFIHYSATFAVGLLLSYYLQSARALNAQTTGLVMLSQPVMMALVSPAAGRISDRVAPRYIASLGMAFTFIGLCLFFFITPATPLRRIVAIQILMGIGFGLFSSPNTNAIMSAVARPRYGVASAVLATMRMVGQALSMAFMALFFAIFLADTAIENAPTPLLMRSIRLSFGVFAALCFVGIFASLARRGRAPAGDDRFGFATPESR